MYHISDRIVVGIYIDGKEFPTTNAGFEYIHLVATSRFLIPTLTCVLIDSFNVFKKLITLADGVTLTVRIGKSLDNFKDYFFRVFSVKSYNEQGVSKYKIAAYTDYPKYFNETATLALTGTSSSVIGQIATKFKIPFVGVPTSDNQVWLPNNRRWCVWAKEIAKFGFSNDRSCMKLAMTSTGELRYVDINKISYSNAPEFLVGTPNNRNVFEVLDIKTVGTSGTMNAISGYNHKLIVQDLSSGNRVKSTVDLKRISSNTQINKGIKSSIKQAKVEFSPITVGTQNTHDNYHEAQYQNTRIGNMLTQGVEILVQSVTNVDIFDPIAAKTKTTPSVDQIEFDGSNSGNYVVTGKAIKITGANYFEKIVAFRDGTNSDPGKTDTQL